jgi:hypothetical protein
MSPVMSLDPMLVGDIGLRVVLIVILKVAVVFVVGLLVTMFMVWFERRTIATMQNRVGPNKAGPFGLLQTLADPGALGPFGLPVGSVSVARSRFSRVCRHPLGRRLPRRRGWSRHLVR